MTSMLIGVTEIVLVFVSLSSILCDQRLAVISGIAYRRIWLCVAFVCPAAASAYPRRRIYLAKADYVSLKRITVARRIPCWRGPGILFVLCVYGCGPVTYHPHHA